MPDFKEKLMRHAEHVKNVGPHCQSEETTKQALVLPFLSLLDFNPFDPLKVKAEFGADIQGIKANERVDYALFSDGHPVMFIEAKPYTEKLTNHTSQIARYFNATPGVAISALTNGREWRFYTDLKNPNIMDDVPFYKVDFSNISEADAEQLARFRYDRFSPDRLRTFAEERVYLDIFQNVIESVLRDPDAEFVRLVATKANLAPKLTGRFIDSITPLVKQSVADAISKMVVSGLSTPPPSQCEIAPVVSDPSQPPDTEQIDADNPKIITTADERKILSIVQMITEGQAESDEVIGKDTESYYAVLYQGKVNRWILRYQGDRQRPLVSFIVDLTDEHKALITRSGLEFGPGGTVILNRPENLVKLSGIVFDALAFCQDNNNFKRESRKGAEAEALA
ncbi:type I restriction endonuclease [Geobacter sulfurreducens]|uniref:type I restriction endonuclease n=1 Tax=Geobacter sulfurreducens TaxID=35554 RepID=UPI002BF4B819|nr:type I restriction endonuclease [Geobacter sulfurreducens]HML79523.1 type I restriction endonuclease [Geobacter sulfurreducens]